MSAMTSYLHRPNGQAHGFSNFGLPEGSVSHGPTHNMSSINNPLMAPLPPILRANKYYSEGAQHSNAPVKYQLMQDQSDDPTGQFLCADSILFIEKKEHHGQSDFRSLSFKMKDVSSWNSYLTIPAGRAIFGASNLGQDLLGCISMFGSQVGESHQLARIDGGASTNVIPAVIQLRARTLNYWNGLETTKRHRGPIRAFDRVWFLLIRHKWTDELASQFAAEDDDGSTRIRDYVMKERRKRLMACEAEQDEHDGLIKRKRIADSGVVAANAAEPKTQEYYWRLHPWVSEDGQPPPNSLYIQDDIMDPNDITKVQEGGEGFVGAAIYVGKVWGFYGNMKPTDASRKIARNFTFPESHDASYKKNVPTMTYVELFLGSE